VGTKLQEIALVVIRILVFLIGFAVVALVLLSAIRSFVLPRSAPDKIGRFTFLSIRFLFNLRMRKVHAYLERDRIMALFAPISLVALPAVWLTGILAGYMCMYWAVQNISLTNIFKISGSSLFTLGYATLDDLPTTVLIFTEAAIGLFLIALLIAYLPTMYAAFSKREAAVTLLEVRAGSPPSAIVMFKRHQRIHGLDKLGTLWVTWEAWFAELEESHTSLGPLVFFRSPQPHRSWVTAAGAVLDAAALANSTLDIPHDPQADLCIRAGFLALRYICDFFRIKYDPEPKSTDPISIQREEFDAAYDELAAAGIPLKPDRDQAWRDYSGWRVNYDTPLLSLAGLTMAPEAPWSSDRAKKLSELPLPRFLR
jgi:hypothetical protein